VAELVGAKRKSRFCGVLRPQKASKIGVAGLASCSVHSGIGKKRCNKIYNSNEFRSSTLSGHLGKGRFQTCPFTLKIIAKSYLTSYIGNNLLNYAHPSEEKIKNG
jgi:hypothetical protein